MNSLISRAAPYLQESLPCMSAMAPRAKEIVSKIGLSQLAQIHLVYQLFDSGLANFLALDTARHGTTLYSYLKIQFQGGKTCYGGHVNDINQSESLNRIFAFSDESTLVGLTKVPLYTSYFSGYAHFARMDKFIGKKIEHTFLELPLLVLSFLPGLISPTVKYRFTPQEIKRKFEHDEDNVFDGKGGMVLHTKENIGISHLGITGSLIQGMNPSIFGRIYNKPEKFALGCAQLVAAIALTCIYCGILTSSPLINTSITVIAELMNQHAILSKIALCAIYFTTW